MKVVLVTLVLSMLSLGVPSVAFATENTMTTTVVKRPSCDQRAPRVEVTLTAKAQRVGFGYPESDTIYWLDTGGVAAGTHRYTLARQPFGSTREWVMVAAFKGEQGLYTNPTLTFKRPARSQCVVTQNLRITTYSGDVNQACPAGTQKLFIVKAFVEKGTPGYFAGYSFGEIVLRSDLQLNTDGYIVPPNQREDDFFFYPQNRGAKVKLSSAENSVTVVTSSENVDVTVGALDSDCLEMAQ